MKTRNIRTVRIKWKHQDEKIRMRVARTFPALLNVKPGGS
jgi:hypothetical protein